MSEQRLIDANALREAVSLLVPSPSTPDYCGRYDQEIMAAQEMCVDIMNAIDAAPTVPAVVLPCDYGAKLYKVTTPYRQEPRITEFIVVNFRTAGQKHVLQVEVRVNGMPGTNWMPYSKFHASKEEAEAALRRVEG